MNSQYEISQFWQFPRLEYLTRKSFSRHNVTGMLQEWEHSQNLDNMNQTLEDENFVVSLSLCFLSVSPIFLCPEKSSRTWCSGFLLLCDKSPQTEWLQYNSEWLFLRTPWCSSRPKGVSVPGKFTLDSLRLKNDNRTQQVEKRSYRALFSMR